jgi:hypothetical protein
MTQAAKWLTLTVAILVVGAVAIVAIIRLTGKDTASGTSDIARARADSAIFAHVVGVSDSDSKVRVTSIKSVGDQLWRVVLRTSTSNTNCYVLDMRQFRLTQSSTEWTIEGIGSVSCAFGR